MRDVAIVSFSQLPSVKAIDAADEPELHQAPYLSRPPARRCPESAGTNGQTVRRRGGSILSKALSYVRNRVARLRRRPK